MDKPFDPLEALAKRAAASIDETGPKLRFFDKCAAFACLYGGTKSSVVSKAFGISSATVSYLAGCRPIDDRKPVSIAFNPNTPEIVETITPTNLNTRRSSDRRPRYQDVAREFDRLGEETFLRTYYTADIDARIERIERNRPKPGDNRTPFSANPKADSHQDVHNFGLNPFGAEECIRIVFIPNDGWVYDGCTPEGKKIYEQWNWTRDDNNKPFRTSKAAYEHYLIQTNRRA